MSEQPKETDLLRRVRAGDPEALSGLYHRYSDDVYRLAFRLTESSADAQDVVQDVFLGLPEAMRSFQHQGSFASWLKRMAARCALMKLRSQRIRGEVPLAAFGHLMQRRDVGPTVDRLALERAISSLPEALRFVVVLKEIEGFSHREIADLLGISRANSEVRHYRALNALRAALRSSR